MLTIGGCMQVIVFAPQMPRLKSELCWKKCTFLWWQYSVRVLQNMRWVRCCRWCWERYFLLNWFCCPSRTTSLEIESCSWQSEKPLGVVSPVPTMIFNDKFIFSQGMCITSVCTPVSAPGRMSVSQQHAHTASSSLLKTHTYQAEALMACSLNFNLKSLEQWIAIRVWFSLVSNAHKVLKMISTLQDVCAAWALEIWCRTQSQHSVYTRKGDNTHVPTEHTL